MLDIKRLISILPASGGSEGCYQGGVKDEERTEEGERKSERNTEEYLSDEVGLRLIQMSFILKYSNPFLVKRLEKTAYINHRKRPFYW